MEITYVDDEMDNICFSSDEELVDALFQFPKLKHSCNSSVVLRCKAVVKDRKLKGKKSKKSSDSATNERDMRLKGKSSKKSNDYETNGKDNSGHSGQASGDRTHACPKLSAACSSPRNRSGFDREFVHARHTCDGCGTAPIIGLRYHAVNISDYDYCETCMANYDGVEVTFQVEQLGKFYANVFLPFTKGSSVRPDILPFLVYMIHFFKIVTSVFKFAPRECSVNVEICCMSSR